MAALFLSNPNNPNAPDDMFGIFAREEGRHEFIRGGGPANIRFADDAVINSFSCSGSAGQLATRVHQLAGEALGNLPVMVYSEDITYDLGSRNRRLGPGREWFFEFTTHPVELLEMVTPGNKPPTEGQLNTAGNLTTAMEGIEDGVLDGLPANNPPRLIKPPPPFIP